MTQGSLIRVERRFRGPPESANGGYICGCLAALATGTVRIRLLSPPPLDVVMHALARDDGGLDLLHGGQRVASTLQDALPAAAQFDPEQVLVAPPSYEQALQASQQFIGLQSHPFEGCFVCGPARARGDGLRIFAGPVPTLLERTQLYAAPWLPHESVAGPDGRVAAEFMWAALDCPGFAAASPQGRLMLLGEFTAPRWPQVRSGDRAARRRWRMLRAGAGAVGGAAARRRLIHPARSDAGRFSAATGAFACCCARRQALCPHLAARRRSGRPSPVSRPLPASAAGLRRCRCR